MIDQAANLRRKLALHHAATRARTIAVISGKGGVGKSNFALNFALGLAGKEKKVLIFDLDIGMGNIEILMGRAAGKSIIHLFSSGSSMEEIIEKGPNSISYISGGTGLENIFTMDNEKFDYFLSQFELLLTVYEFIIFDMGAGITEGSANFILAADECIVVTTPEPTSLTDAYGMIKHIVKKSPELPIQILVNRVHNRQKGEQTMHRLINVVEQFLHKEIKALGMLPEDKKVMQAVSEQVPFLLYQQKSPAALSIAAIANHYLNEESKLAYTAGNSFIDKIKTLIKKR